MRDYFHLPSMATHCKPVDLSIVKEENVDYDAAQSYSVYDAAQSYSVKPKKQMDHLSFELEIKAEVESDADGSDVPQEELHKWQQNFLSEAGAACAPKQDVQGCDKVVGGVHHIHTSTVGRFRKPADLAGLDMLMDSDEDKDPDGIVVVFEEDEDGSDEEEDNGEVEEVDSDATEIVAFELTNEQEQKQLNEEILKENCEQTAAGFINAVVADNASLAEKVKDIPEQVAVAVAENSGFFADWPWDGDVPENDPSFDIEQDSASKKRGRKRKKQMTKITKNTCIKKNEVIEGKSRVCSFCGKVLKTVIARKRHEDAHTHSRSYECSECPKKYYDEKALLFHQKIHDKQETEHTCNICERKFTRGNHLRQHLKTHEEGKGTTCCFCGKTFSKPCKTRIHERVHTGEKPFKCGVCDKTFVNVGQRNFHQKLHFEDQLLACAVCGRKFRRMADLDRHTRSHTGDKPFTCDICGKGYPSKESMKAHIRTHSETKPHVCEVCGHGFRKGKQLRQHARTHKGELLFQCSFPNCGIAFDKEDSCRRHEIRTHGDQKPYDCPLCPEYLRTQGDLKDHVYQVHGEAKMFRCQYCERGFSSEANRKRHERCHTGDRPFKCHFCEKAFIQKRTMEDHQRTHTGEKPFQCQTCGKAFTQISNLRTHKRNTSHD